MSVIDLAASPSDLRAVAEQSNAWPFEQAKAIVARLKRKPKDEVLFETGYGPSGLPHIGTFGEVARTTMVRHAFRVLTEDKIKTRLLAFSDDMDGLRKVPDNVPNKEMLAEYLGKPLTKVPDPFGTHPSFGAHNNARLRAFLDTFGFDYEFASSTDYYTSGRFDATLLKMLERIEKVMAIMLPSLREERAASYSPFLPICPRTGTVLYVPITAHDIKAGTISYDDPETKERVTLPVTGGRCKLQWKPDWAMRWAALGVDYEMAGKDLIDSVKLSGKICAALDGMPPEGFNYELFLDEKGQKISKSKGNGLTIDEWLRYASPESLSLFMYREPKAAKRLYFDVIPRNVDDYQQFLEGFPRQDARQQLGNPVWHIHAGHPPKADMPVTFQLLLTLVSSSNAENASTLWGFIGRYRPGVTPETHPKLDAMVGYAINYYRDFVAPTKKFREPTHGERAALQDLRDALANLPAESTAEDIQNVVYEIGRREPFLDAIKKGKDGRPGVSLDWFNMLYQVLLGQEKGPRFGSFVAVYGLSNAVAMIDGALARSASAENKAARTISNDDRGAHALKTRYRGVTYRSQTEARWAVFFDSLGVQFSYEPETISLSSGATYMPDFFIKDFNAYFEVKPSSDDIVTAEATKARCLAHDRPGQRVWLAIGAPAPKTPNILVLDQWPQDEPIEKILGNPDHRYWFHEDRRDERVYWLHSEMVHGFVVGGPGRSTDHDRPPLNHRCVAEAYKQARAANFGKEV